MTIPKNPRPLARRLDEIIEGLPEDRRLKVEARTAQLIKEASDSYLPSMYGSADDDEDEDAPVKPTQVPITDVTMAVVDKSVIVVIDGKKIEIPNMVYVRTLERTINKQAREIQRLNNATKNLRERANTLLAEVKDVWKEVGYKIDQRGMS